MNVSNVLTKTVGVIGLGLVAYDSHAAGKHEAHAHEKEHKATSLAGRYLEDTKLDSNSMVKAQAKEHIFKYFMDENISGFFGAIKGYTKGFSEVLVSNVVPFALAVGTLLTNKKNSKNIISKCFGAGLLAYGGIFLAQEIFGIGKAE